MDEIIKALRLVKKMNLYPYSPVVNSPHKPEVIINGKKTLLFASNNYLNLMTDQRVIEAAVEGAKKWGIGNGSARLLTGNLSIHVELEKKIADFKKREAGLTFVSGYMVNSGCIPSIMNVLDPTFSGVLGKLFFKKKTIIFSDEYNHASIVTGARLSGSIKEIYKHNDFNDLEKRLRKYSKKSRKLIISDGVFSMDGDIVDLPKLLELAKEYNAMTYIDDAHASGIIGPKGGGTEDFYNLSGKVDFMMGTFTKCFGGVGGYITSKKEVIEYLKITAKDFIFTAPIAPPVVCGLIKSLEIIKKEDWRRIKLLDNANYLRSKLNENNFNVLGSTQILPVLVGDEKKADCLAKRLLECGFFIPVARWPAVPRGQARLRLTVMTDHKKEHIDSLIKTLIKLRKEIKF